jgi:hypothetical protein
VVAEPDQVKAQLPALAEVDGIDETVVPTICHDFAARKAAARCFADACGIEKPD